MLALEAGELETLSPIRLRYTGDIQDLTASRDDQDVLRTEVQTVKGKIINTTVGRVILNQSIPAEMPFVNGLLKKKGLQQLVQSCYSPFFFSRPLTNGISTGMDWLRMTRPTVVLMILPLTVCTSVRSTSWSSRDAVRSWMSPV